MARVWQSPTQDLEARLPMRQFVRPNTTLTSVLEVGGSGFFQAFIGATPRCENTQTHACPQLLYARMPGLA